MYKNVPSSFIHNIPKLEATSVSNNRGIGELWIIHTLDSSSAKKRSILIYTTWINLKNMLNERRQHKRVHTVLFHLYEVLGQAKLTWDAKIQNGFLWEYEGGIYWEGAWELSEGIVMLEFGLHSSRSHQMDIWAFNIWMFHCVSFLAPPPPPKKKEKRKNFQSPIKYWTLDPNDLSVKVFRSEVHWCLRPTLKCFKN